MIQRRQIGNVDKTLAGGQSAAYRCIGTTEALAQTLYERFRDAADARGVEMFALTEEQAPVVAVTETVCLL